MKRLPFDWRQILIIFALIVLVVIFISASSAEQASITVDSGVSYQMIVGWEGLADIGLSDFKDTFPSWQDEALDKVAFDLGINRVRLEARAGMENPTDYFSQWYNDMIPREEWRSHWAEVVNDNSDPNVINPSGFQFALLDYHLDEVVVPLKERVETKGEKLYVNLEYVGGTESVGGPPTLHSNNPAEYSEFILAIFQHMDSKYGFVPDAVEIVNEPRSSNGWSSASQVGEALVAAANRLQAAGYSPDFIAPSNANATNALNWFDTIISMNEVPSHLSELSYHRYGGDGTTTLSAIGDRTVTYGVRSGMLEKFDGGGTYHALHQDLKIAQVSAWQQFVLAFPTNDNGAQYYWIDTSDQANPIVNIGSRTKFLRQYFKFVRSGAIRIGATSSNNSFDPVAFINSDGGYVVVVKADSSGSFSVEGLPAGTYGIKYTTSQEYDVDLADVTIGDGQSLNSAIPATGVATVYRKSDSEPPPPPDFDEFVYIPVLMKRPISTTSTGSLTTDCKVRP